MYVLGVLLYVPVTVEMTPLLPTVTSAGKFSRSLLPLSASPVSLAVTPSLPRSMPSLPLE